MRRSGWWVDRWAVASQDGARRNAMAASTRLSAQRHERLEIEEYVETLLAQRGPRAGPDVEPVEVRGAG